MLYLDLNLEECISKLTKEPAEKLSLGNIGEIKIGFKADFTVFELIDEQIELIDSVNKTVKQKPYVNGKYAIVNGIVYKSKGGN